VEVDTDTWKPSAHSTEATDPSFNPFEYVTAPMTREGKREGKGNGEKEGRKEVRT
jgi:hypothetical protein